MIIKPEISAVLITDDNVECINAIESVLDSCIEVIVVNNGKTTNVNELCKKYGDKVKVIYFEWCNDYSKARNFGIDKAKGNWILTIDSDEILQNRIEFLDNKYLAYLTKQQNDSFGYLTARLFQNKPGIRYRNKVHETIDHCITPETCCESDIVLKHSGYNITDEQMKAKMKRNYDLMFQDKGNRVYNLHMGNYYFTIEKDYHKALKFYKKATKDKLNDEHLAVIYMNIHACQFMLKYPLKSLLETLYRSLVFEPFQLHCRVNVVEHLLSVINEENKDRYIYQVRNELGKIERIKQYGLSNLIFKDTDVSVEWIQEKYNELSKFGIERIAV